MLWWVNFFFPSPRQVPAPAWSARLKVDYSFLLCVLRALCVETLRLSFRLLTFNFSTLKNHLRQRLSRRVCDAQHDIFHAKLLRYLPRFTPKLQRRPSARFPHHFQIHPSHAPPPARS